MTNRKGYIHLYTGNGKGKTTAAIGIAIRAAGGSLRTFFAQFVKGKHYCELDIIKNIPGIELVQYGRDCFIRKEPDVEDIRMAFQGFKDISSIILNNEYDVVILDEICIALHYRLIPIDKLIDLLKNKPKNMEIILTGRYAPLELYEISNLVTYMAEVKHYYKNGVKARKGIEF
jgi:cob(I)alamin adenosyltransferase